MIYRDGIFMAISYEAYLVPVSMDSAQGCPLHHGYWVHL